MGRPIERFFGFVLLLTELSGAYFCSTEVNASSGGHVEWSSGGPVAPAHFIPLLNKSAPRAREPPSMPNELQSRQRRQGTASYSPNSVDYNPKPPPSYSASPGLLPPSQVPPYPSYPNQPTAPGTSQVSPSNVPPTGGSEGGGIIPTAKGEAHRYYYPPRMPLPLPTCFHNPTGYPCCNPMLNDLIVEAYTELEARPRFHTCNINAIATLLQSKAEQRFNTSFESIVSFEDFAQKIHFNGDLVCKVELGGKYMLVYGTVRDASRSMALEEVEAVTIGNGRRKREMPLEIVIGPENELPLIRISRHHTMWI